MISETTLVFILKAFCQLHTMADFEHPIKGQCIEYMINCTVPYNSQTTEQLVDKCKEAWAEKEVQLKKELK